MNIHGDSGPMQDKTKSVGLHDDTVWKEFVANVTLGCTNALNRKAQQAEVDNTQYKCFLDDVAKQLGITGAGLKPMLGTKPLEITKTSFLHKRGKSLPVYLEDVVQSVREFQEGTHLREISLAEAIVANELADGDDAPQLAKTALEGDKAITLNITQAYRKADQCNQKDVPADVLDVINSDLKRLIDKCKATLAKAVAAQLMAQYTLAMRQLVETLDSNSDYSSLTFDQMNEAIKACIHEREPSTEIDTLIVEADNSTAAAPSTRKAPAAAAPAAAAAEAEDAPDPIIDVDRKTAALPLAGGEHQSEDGPPCDGELAGPTNGTVTAPRLGTPCTPRDNASSTADSSPSSSASDGRADAKVAISAKEKDLVMNQLFDDADEIPTTPRSPPRGGGGTKRDASQELGRSQDRSQDRSQGPSQDEIYGECDGNLAYQDHQFWLGQDEQ